MKSTLFSNLCFFRVACHNIKENLQILRKIDEKHTFFIISAIWANLGLSGMSPLGPPQRAPGAPVTIFGQNGRWPRLENSPF